jgi:hypothetical protein
MWPRGSLEYAGVGRPSIARSAGLPTKVVEDVKSGRITAHVAARKIRNAARVDAEGVARSSLVRRLVPPLGSRYERLEPVAPATRPRAAVAVP